MSDKAGIYIHFPFCIKKCLYCGFYSIPHDRDLENKYIECLIKEIYIQKKSAENLRCSSIYLGGGTPSLINHNNLKKVIEKLFENFNIDNNAEITLEVNPASVNHAQIKKIASLKINRFSLGIQSFNDNILSCLGRPHNSNDAIKTYHTFVEEGCTNISTDLIFAIPGQTMQQWQESLKKLMLLSPKHISLYSFSFDKDTHFTKCYQKGKIFPVEEHLESEMYEYAIDFLSCEGYVHYEISNFALPGFESNHNKLYWNNHSYVGLGASAFSYINKKRYSTVSDVNQYINLIEHNKNPYSYSEKLSDEKSLRETAALNLRLINEGINLNKLQERYKRIHVKRLLETQLDNLVDEGLLVYDNKSYRLTPKGIFLADYAASCIV